MVQQNIGVATFEEPCTRLLISCGKEPISGHHYVGPPGAIEGLSESFDPSDACLLMRVQFSAGIMRGTWVWRGKTKGEILCYSTTTIHNRVAGLTHERLCNTRALVIVGCPGPLLCTQPAYCTNGDVP